LVLLALWLLVLWSCWSYWSLWSIGLWSLVLWSIGRGLVEVIVSFVFGPGPIGLLVLWSGSSQSVLWSVVCFIFGPVVLPGVLWSSWSCGPVVTVCGHYIGLLVLLVLLVTLGPTLVCGPLGPIDFIGHCTGPVVL
jgi:hypothetical protein